MAKLNHLSQIINCGFMRVYPYFICVGAGPVAVQSLRVGVGCGCKVCGCGAGAGLKNVEDVNLYFNAPPNQRILSRMNLSISELSNVDDV
jgi:hypothetical protein